MARSTNQRQACEGGIIPTGVTDSGDVLNDDQVVGVLAPLDDFTGLAGQLLGRLEEHRVGSDHVIDLAVSCVSVKGFAKLTTLDLEISLERNCLWLDKFFPSLLPRWLYDEMDNGLIPALTKNSARTDLTLV